MSYIRTNDTIMCTDEMTLVEDERFGRRYLNIHNFPIVPLKEAETIEELIQDGDMLYIHDLYPDTVLVVDGYIKPFGYVEKCILNCWLTNSPGLKRKYDLYIKDQHDNYIKVAISKEGILELKN